MRNGTTFTLVTDVGDIDLLGEVSGVGTFTEMIEEAASVELIGVRIKIISLGGLIKAKRSANRPKDLSVLPELEALREVLTDEI